MRAVAILFTMSSLPFVGGCCFPSPSVDTVKGWVSRELPPGSSESDVKEFSSRHDLTYYRSNTVLWGQAYRGQEGCDWANPIVKMDVYYDERLIIKSTEVYDFKLMP